MLLDLGINESVAVVHQGFPFDKTKLVQISSNPAQCGDEFRRYTWRCVDPVLEIQKQMHKCKFAAVAALPQTEDLEHFPPNLELKNGKSSIHNDEGAISQSMNRLHMPGGITHEQHVEVDMILRGAAFIACQYAVETNQNIYPLVVRDAPIYKLVSKYRRRGK